MNHKYSVGDLVKILDIDIRGHYIFVNDPTRDPIGKLGRVVGVYEQSYDYRVSVPGCTEYGYMEHELELVFTQ